MSAVSRNTILPNFQAGDRPTDSQYAQLIESALNLVDDRKLLGLQPYDDTRALGYQPGDTCLRDGVLKECVTATGGTYTPSHWKDVRNGALKVRPWVPNAEFVLDEYCEWKAKNYKALVNVTGVEPGTLAAQGVWLQIDAPDGLDIQPYAPGLYATGATRKYNSRILELTAAGDASGLVDCSADTFPDPAKWEDLGIGRPSIIYVTRQGMIGLRDLDTGVPDPDNPPNTYIGAYDPGVYIITDALEELVGGVVVAKPVKVLADSRNTFVEARRLTDDVAGTYTLTGGAGGVDTFVAASGGGGPAPSNSYILEAEFIARQGQGVSIGTLIKNTFPNSINVSTILEFSGAGLYEFSDFMPAGENAAFISITCGNISTVLNNPAVFNKKIGLNDPRFYTKEYTDDGNGSFYWTTVDDWDAVIRFEVIKA